jgi:hypothetical protein
MSRSDSRLIRLLRIFVWGLEVVRRRAMLVLKYLVMLAGLGLFGSAGALVGYDIFLSAQLRKLLRRTEQVERMS